MVVNLPKNSTPRCEIHLRSYTLEPVNSNFKLLLWDGALGGWTFSTPAEFSYCFSGMFHRPSYFNFKTYRLCQMVISETHPFAIFQYIFLFMSLLLVTVAQCLQGLKERGNNNKKISLNISEIRDLGRARGYCCWLTDYFHFAFKRPTNLDRWMGFSSGKNLEQTIHSCISDS